MGHPEPEESGSRHLGMNEHFGTMTLNSQPHGSPPHRFFTEHEMPLAQEIHAIRTDLVATRCQTH
jgi:hypothetical protein